MLVIGDYLQNRYRVVAHLGRGGMGTVFEARDERFDISVALKEVTIDLSQLPDANKQHGMVGRAFEREAKTLAKLHHEAFPHVIDYFSERGKQFLVMELVQGQDLGSRLYERHGPFGLEEVLNWTHQLLDALDYLHTQDPPIVHRDLKPQNLKLTSRGKIKLLDFGIAKGIDAKSGHTTITNQTFVAATLNYSPIEQLLRVLDPTFREVIIQRYENKIEDLLNQQADARSDLYSLGATLYHFLTGVVPADALKRLLDVWSGKPDPLRPPAQINLQIAEEISAFLLKALEIERERRFASAAEMQKELRMATGAWQIRVANEQAERARREEEECLERERREAAERERLRLEAERREHERLRQIEEERQRQMALEAEHERLRLEVERQERMRREAQQQQQRQAEILERDRLEAEKRNAFTAQQQQQQQQRQQYNAETERLPENPVQESEANEFATTSQISSIYTKTSFLKGILPEEEPAMEVFADAAAAAPPAPSVPAAAALRSETKKENTAGFLPLSSILENVPPENHSSRKSIWIWPAAALLVLLFGGGLLGLWLMGETETTPTPPSSSSATTTERSVQADSSLPQTSNSSPPPPNSVINPQTVSEHVTSPSPGAAAETDIMPDSTAIVPPPTMTSDSPKPASQRSSARTQQRSEQQQQQQQQSSASSSNPNRSSRPTTKPSKPPVTLDDFLKQKP